MEQLAVDTEAHGHYLFVGERSRSAGCYPLIVLLQHGVGFRGVEVVGRGAAFERSQPTVLIDRDHDRSLTA